MRELVCTQCQEIIVVYEEPCEHIDPDLYRCPTCREPTGKQVQLDIDGRTEMLTGYRPDMAEIPF